MPLETRPWDSAEFIDQPAAEAAFLEAAFETGDPVHIGAAVGIVARARGMAQIAAQVGLTREEMFAALNGPQGPSLPILHRVASRLGADLAVAPAAE